MIVTFSIVIPVYNSEASLYELLSGIEGVMKDKSYEVVLVDDGSKDQSWDAIMNYKQTNSQAITAIKLSRNFGQHNAILCGLNHCKGEFVITIDDDLQHPPIEILKLIDQLNKSDSDVVYGTFEEKQHAKIRNWGSFFTKKTARLSGSPGDGSSFRIIKRWVVDKIKENHQHNFIFIDEIMQWYTSSISFVKVKHLPRKYGKSNYSVSQLAIMYFDILFNYTAVPLKAMTYGGLLLSALTSGIGFWFAYRKYIYHVPLGYTSIIVAIFFTASIMLFCFGIVGQYIYKLYQFQQKKPGYAIQKIVDLTPPD
jgi:glycosyltransferase involved in cell wall biosynthesis